ncbi:MAG TPA: pilin [Candidatus Woesebacteria bacterium]|nr:pilin [Candidatus Woesebacteria bacterium]
MLNLIQPIWAQETFDLTPKNEFAPLGKFRVNNLVQTLFSVLLVAVGLVFLFMLILGGLKWMTSEGDEKKLAAARGQITNALIGLVIVFSAWAIVALINTIFGINLLNFTIRPISSTSGV